MPLMKLEDHEDHEEKKRDGPFVFFVNFVIPGLETIL